MVMEMRSFVSKWISTANQIEKIRTWARTVRSHHYIPGFCGYVTYSSAIYCTVLKSIRHLVFVLLIDKVI